MSNALVTIIAPLDLDRLGDAEASIDKLGNPARPEIRAALDKHEDGENGTHFASLHAIKSQDGKRGYIVLEFSADGTEDKGLERIERQIGEHLRRVFMHSSDWTDSGELLAFLRKYKVITANGWSATPGALFAGTPGLPVGRILRASKLAARITARLAEQGPDLTALERVTDIRNDLKNEKDAFTPATPTPPFEQQSIVV